MAAGGSAGHRRARPLLDTPLRTGILRGRCTRESVYFWRRDTLFAASIRRDPEVAVLDTRAVLSDVEVLLPFWDLHPDGDRAVLRTQGAVPDDGGTEDGDPEADPDGGWLVVVHWFTELQARLATS